MATESQTPKSSFEVVDNDTPDASTFPNRPIRVLSLCDGICTGMFVLDELDLEVETFYASGVCELAKNVASLKFGSRITFIENVAYFTDKEITQICPIDLLIGCSPCNDLSIAKLKRKKLYNFDGIRWMFLHYYRVLNQIQISNRGNHLFWLYENFANMPREFKEDINIFLKKKPHLIYAEHISPKSQPKYLWGNFPEMSGPFPKGFSKKCNLSKVFWFLQYYENVGKLSPRELQNLLEKSWNVPVLQHTLKPLAKYFPTKTKQHGKGKPDESRVRPSVMNEDSESRPRTDDSQIRPTVHEDSNSRPIVDIVEIPMENTQKSTTNALVSSKDHLQVCKKHANKTQMEHNGSSAYISTNMKSWQVIDEYDADISSDSSSDSY